MTNWTKFCGLTAFATMMTSTAAFADVNAQDVWGDWKAYMSAFGYEVTGAESTAGDTLSVTDLKMTMALPEDEGSVAITMSEMTFTNQGDGTVSVGVPSSMPLLVEVAPDSDDAVTMNVDYDTSGLSMIVSGTPNDMTYTYSADEMAVSLASMVVEGEPVPINAAKMVFKAVSGNSTMKKANLREVSQVMNAEEVSYTFDAANPEDTSEFVKMTGMAKAVKFEGGGSYPSGIFDSQNMDEMMKAGFAAAGTFSYQGGSSNLDFADDGENMQGKTKSDSGSLNIAMSADGIRYGGDIKGVEMNFAGADLPFPVDIRMANGGFNLALPVSKSDEAQDFGLGLTLGDVAVSEEIWSMGDPTGQLPHDPATIAFDLSGKAKLGFDLLDPEQMEAVESGEIAMPGEVESVDLNNLEVTIAGASLTGTGNFVIDFAEAMMSEGMQGIDGALNLKLAGANALMDKLVEMGMLPEDQVMGARMMLGMFAVPEGDDVLVSKIEMKKDGQVLANGQRLK